MKTSKLPIRTSALLLAIASCACAQTKSTPPGGPPETQPANVGSNTPGNESDSRPSKPGRVPGGSGGGGSSSGGGSGRSPAMWNMDPNLAAKAGSSSKIRGISFARSSNTDTPVVLMTKPTERAVEDEWIEDLKVMDKLLRDAIGDTGGNDPSAMGIPLVMLGRATPMYVEDCGVILRTGVSWPLAAGKGTGKSNDKPRERVSAWILAKREIAGDRPGAAPEFTDMPTFPPFAQEKLDALVAGIVRILPEASNMRHLQPDEFVFISVSGSDDSGAPARLTLKARKSDIDAASAGKLKVDEFKQRISLRIG